MDFYHLEGEIPKDNKTSESTRTSQKLFSHAKFGSKISGDAPTGDILPQNYGLPLHDHADVINSLLREWYPRLKEKRMF